MAAAKRVDVGLGGVEGAHPAHLAGLLVPDVEAEALLQPLGDVARAGRAKTALACTGRWTSTPGTSRTAAGEPPRPSRWRGGRCAATGRRRAAPRTAPRRSASWRRAASTSCAGSSRPRDGVRVEHDDGLAEQQAVLGAAEGEHVDAGVGGERPQRHVRGRRPRWRSGRRRGAPSCRSAWAWSQIARDLVGRVAGAELGGLGDRDDLRLRAVLVAAAPGLPVDQLGGELAVRGGHGEQLEPADPLRRAALVDVDVRASRRRSPRPSGAVIACSATTLAPVPLKTGNASRRVAEVAAEDLLQARGVDVRRRRRPGARRWPAAIAASTSGWTPA